VENAAVLKECRSQSLVDLRPKFMPKYKGQHLEQLARILPAISVGNNITLDLPSILHSSTLTLYPSLLYSYPLSFITL
jgi:hypothetical protein